MKVIFGCVLLGILFLLLCLISIPSFILSNRVLADKISEAIDWTCDKYLNNEEDLLP